MGFGRFKELGQALCRDQGIAGNFAFFFSPRTERPKSGYESIRGGGRIRSVWRAKPSRRLNPPFSAKGPSLDRLFDNGLTAMSQRGPNENHP